MSAASATSRAIGPSTVSVSNGSSAGPRAIRPGDGRRPTTEQNDAGVRRLPPRSEPVASQTWRLASATADPPDDPPHVRLVSHGFRVAAEHLVEGLRRPPRTRACSTWRRRRRRAPRAARPGCRSAPARGRRRSASRRSCGRRRRRSDPSRQSAVPPMPIGGPAVAALASARSAQMVGSAFSEPSTASIRRSAASTRSRGSTSPARRAATAARAESDVRSFGMSR